MCSRITVIANATTVTPAVGLLLTTCALLAADPLAGAAADKDPSARAEATLRRVVKLSPEQQQVWLRLVEQRYSWAVLITMKPDEARRERERAAAILRRKSVAWNDLAALLQQLDQREKAAVSQMVRLYRTKVYDNFSKRENELIDRQEAWYRIWSAWEKAGSPPEQQDRLMDWLAAAIKASSKESLGPLPVDPKFGPDVELVPEVLVKQLRDVKELREKRLREEQAKRRIAEAAPPDRGGKWPPGPVPGPETPVRAPLATRLPDPQWTSGRMSASTGAVVMPRGDWELGIGDWPSNPPSLVPNPSLPAPATDDPIVLTSPPLTRPHDGLIALDTKASAAAAEVAEPVLAARGDESARPQAFGPARPPAELPSERAIAPAIAPEIAGHSPARLPAAAARTPVTAEPPTASESAPRGDVLAMLPPQALRSAAPAPDEPHAQVNIEELRTRIEGINLSLRTLEGELNDKGDLAADRLDSLLSRLDILVLRQRDLALFRALVTAREQAKVGQIDSSLAAIAALGTRIAELRSKIRHNESLREPDRAAVLKHLDDLSDRLATLTAEK